LNIFTVITFTVISFTNPVNHNPSKGLIHIVVRTQDGSEQAPH